LHRCSVSHNVHCCIFRFGQQVNEDESLAEISSVSSTSHESDEAVDEDTESDNHFEPVVKDMEADDDDDPSEEEDAENHPVGASDVSEENTTDDQSGSNKEDDDADDVREEVYEAEDVVSSDDEEGGNQEDNGFFDEQGSNESSNDDSFDEESSNEPKMFKLEQNSRCILELDCDSAYFGHHKFTSLIDACGTNCSFGFDSLVDRHKSSNGFRFGIDTTLLVDNPIYYKSFKAKKINLEALPNVKVAVCMLDAIHGHPMAIYVSYIGSKFIRKSNMFRNEELAVVTAGMNLVKNFIVKDHAIDSRTRFSISQLPTFESKSAERDLDSCKINAHFTISQSKMVLFAEKFEEALNLLGTVDGDDLWRTEYIGMAWEEPLNQKLNFDLIRDFLEDFKHNHYFTANAAGFKEQFKRKNIFIKIRKSGEVTLDNIYPVVEQKLEEIYSCLRNELFGGATFGVTTYFFDIATTLIPNQKNDYSYLINTEKMKPHLVRFLNKR
jgi:hypothetical protein